MATKKATPIELKRHGSDEPICPACGHNNAMLCENPAKATYKCRDCGFTCVSVCFVNLDDTKNNSVVNHVIKNILTTRDEGEGWTTLEQAINAHRDYIVADKGCEFAEVSKLVRHQLEGVPLKKFVKDEPTPSTKDPLTDLAATMLADGISIEVAPGLWRIMTWRELWTAMRVLKNATTPEGEVTGLSDLGFSTCAQEHWGETAAMFQRMTYANQVDWRKVK